MNWGKTKTLLIVLLIAANLLAFSMYVGLKYDRTMLPEEMIENAIENLSARGVTVQNGAIMREKQSIPIYTAVKEKPENCMKRIEREQSEGKPSLDSRVVASLWNTSLQTMTVAASRLTL